MIIIIIIIILVSRSTCAPCAQVTTNQINHDPVNSGNLAAPSCDSVFFFCLVIFHILRKFIYLLMLHELCDFV